MYGCLFGFTKRWLTREKLFCRWRPLRPVTREPLAVCDFRSLDEQSDLVGVMSVLPTRGQHPVYGGSNPKNSTGEIERWVWQLLLSIIHVCICPTTDNLFFTSRNWPTIPLTSGTMPPTCSPKNVCWSNASTLSPMARHDVRHILLSRRSRTKDQQERVSKFDVS